MFNQLIVAQDSNVFKITGNINDESGSLTDIVVDLHILKDSTLFKSEFTNETGSFTFEYVPVGEYFVSVNTFNHNSYQSNISIDEADKNIGNITLTPKLNELKEVVVVSKKPYIERGQGKTILNIESSLSATGSSAFEILEKAPGILISANENIVMRGRQGIIVQVDGKNLPMSGTDLANYLKGLPSGSIERIELITNPSAKYDAAGSAIIDIRLKKDKKLGTNGTVSLSYGQGKYPKTNPSITFNHRTKNINIFGNYNYAYREFFSDLTLNRTFYDNNNFTGKYKQHNYFLYPFNNHIGRIGLDYNIDEKNTIGLVINGISNKYKLRGFNETDVYTEPDLRSNKFKTDNLSDNVWANLEGNINFKHLYTKPGREITFDFDIAQYNNETEQLFSTQYLTLDDKPYQDDYILQGLIDGKLNIYALKFDYTTPINEQTRIDFGLKSSIVNSDNQLVFNDLSNETVVFDSTKSNHFLYDENINAAYFTFSNTINDKINYSVGLRAENTNITGNQIVYNERFDTTYTQLFPTLTVNYKANEKHSFELALNRRIQRPSYSQLNPFKFYLDPTTYKEGNPYLSPQTTNSLDLTYIFNNKISSTFSYFRTNNNITEIIGPSPTEEKVTIQTNENISYAEYYSAYVAIPIEITKWWTTQKDINIYWGQYTGSIANTTINNLGNFNFNINSVNNFTITKNLTAELSGNYRASERYAFEVLQPRWTMNFGIQQKLWDGLGSIRLNVNDVFYSNWVEADVTFTDYTENFLVKRESRVATLALSYRFGKNTVPGSRRRASGADDLKGRAASSPT